VRLANIGKPEENYRVRELAEIVRDTVPGCELELAGDAWPDTCNYRVDCSAVDGGKGAAHSSTRPTATAASPGRRSKATAPPASARSSVASPQGSWMVPSAGRLRRPHRQTLSVGGGPDFAAVPIVVAGRCVG
jgi:hypothetical protein